MTRIIISLALATCLLLVVGAAPAAANEEDWAVQATAIKYYTGAHPGVTSDEALRRIEFQDSMVATIPKIEAALGDRYAGLWFDANDGGQLKVALVGRDTKAAAPALEEARDIVGATGRGGEVEFVDAEWSLDELEVAQKETTTTLEQSGGAATSVAVDVVANAVDVTRSSSAPAATTNAIAQARDATTVPIKQTVVNGDYKPEPTLGCTMPYCDRPLRGGVKTFVDIPIDAVWYPWCTTGFNVTSRSDGKRYVLTAGHCVNLDEEGYPVISGNFHGTKRVTGGAIDEIGPGHSSSWAPGAGDAGIIRNKVPSYWQQSPFPTNTLVVDALPGVTGYMPDYPVTSEANAPVGQVVCTTGGGGTNQDTGQPQRFWEGTQYASWTWCGTVRYASVSADYGGGLMVHNLVETDICTHKGMSGGPVYKWNVAYAINSGAACPQSKGWHYPSIRAENDLNVDIVH